MNCTACLTSRLIVKCRAAPEGGKALAMACRELGIIVSPTAKGYIIQKVQKGGPRLRSLAKARGDDGPNRLPDAMVEEK